MGDLNNTADIRNKGYDLITKAGWEGNNVPFRCASTTSSRTARKRSKRMRSSSTGRNCLACLTIMGLRLRIPERYGLIFAT